MTAKLLIKFDLLQQILLPTLDTQLTRSLGKNSQTLESLYMEFEFSADIIALSELKFLSMRNSCAISIQREMFKARS